jgi:hypothetical protein
MHERVTVKRDGRQVDRGWLIERTTEHVLIESDHAGIFAAHPVREFAGDVTVTFDDPKPVVPHECNSLHR